MTPRVEALEAVYVSKLGEGPVHQVNGNRSFAYRRGYPLHIACSNITDRKHTGEAGL